MGLQIGHVAPVFEAQTEEGRGRDDRRLSVRRRSARGLPGWLHGRRASAVAAACACLCVGAAPAQARHARRLWYRVGALGFGKARYDGRDVKDCGSP